MMKSVLIAIRPQLVEKICHKIGEDETGKAIYEKRIEVRKTAPQEVPFKAYIYCCKAKPYLYKEANPPFELFLDSELYKGKGYDDRLFSGKVVGEFVCDKVIKTCGWRLRGDTQQCAKRTTAEEAFPELACLTIDEIVKYAGSENREVCGWHISDLKIYDKPKALVEFYKCGAESFEELSDTEDLCSYCSDTDYGEHKYDISSCWRMVSCEGCWCDEAYQTYLDENFALTRAPQSWQYVEELEE